MSDAITLIRQDYRATKSSGSRPTSAIKWIVIHDAEVDDDLKGAEKVGSYFASSAARGSTHYGVDDDSTQQYLSDTAIPWGAPGANTNGLHIELMGKASHSRVEWLDHHGPMFDRAGWLIARKAKTYGIPLRLLTIAEYRAGKKGIITHATVSAADGPGGSTHTDPGPNFPIDVLISKANKYASGATTKPQPYPLPEGHVFARDPKHVAWRHNGTENKRDHDCVVRIQRRVGAAADGIFGNETAERVSAFQRRKHISVDGIVGPVTWREITKG